MLNLRIPFLTLVLMMLLSQCAVPSGGKFPKEVQNGPVSMTIYLDHPQGIDAGKMDSSWGKGAWCVIPPLQSYEIVNEFELKKAEGFGKVQIREIKTKLCHGYGEAK